MRCLTSNQYVIRNGKLEVKSKGKTSESKQQPIKVISTQPQKQLENPKPSEVYTQNNQVDISKSNYRYIPYQHTVRKVSMKNYYDTTISKQKKEIEDLKQRYKELMHDYHNNTITSQEKQNLQRIQQVLLFGQPSRVKRIYDLSKSQIMIEPFSIGIQNQVSSRAKQNRCSYWDETPMRSLMKESEIFQSEVICARQVINKQQYLTPKLITRSIIMKNPEQQQEGQYQSRYLDAPKQFQGNLWYQQQKLNQVHVNSLQVYKESAQKAQRFRKNAENRRTRGTDQSIITVKQQDIQQNPHRRSNSILIEGNPIKAIWHPRQNQDEQVNDPITQRNQNLLLENNEEIPDFSCITKSKEGFQQLLNKTIEQHQQLKQLFELYKVSSQERVKQLEQNFQTQLDQMEDKFKKEKQNLQKFAKKAKKYKKVIKQKEQVILDLIQKLRFYVKENQTIKKQQRNKVLLQVMNILKQKQLVKMMKSSKQKNNVQQGRNIILAAIRILTQCRIQSNVLQSMQNNRVE